MINKRVYKQELEIGKKAVITAMRITNSIQKELYVRDIITKTDKSPVTIADFTSQAIVCKILNDNFPEIPIVAEENSNALKNPEHKETLKKIIHFIEREPQVREMINKDILFETIDFGCQSTGKAFWTLDPIDGTKGFIRGEQYAVALALVVEEEVKLGILGCPNLKFKNDRSKSGYLFSAIRNEGAEIFNVEKKTSKRTNISNISDTKKMKFIESYESSHSNLELQNKIAKILNIKNPPVQMDSQVKYGMISNGDAEIYLRIPHPKTPDYKEKIWDHAAGSIIVEESEGIVSDIFGKKLDFNTGKTLKNNTGILASTPLVHNDVLEIIKKNLIQHNK